MKAKLAFSYTHREDIAGQEHDSIDRIASSFMRRVSETLSEMRKEKAEVYLGPKEKMRLLTLRTWEERYRVPLRFILETLIPFWEKFVQRRSKRMKSRGLNVRVATLVGKKSEQILQEAIEDIYPGEQNKRIWISLERERLYTIMASRMRDKFSPELKNVFEYKTPSHWAKAYARAIREETKIRDITRNEMKRRPYRGNPFREETV